MYQFPYMLSESKYMKPKIPKLDDQQAELYNIIQKIDRGLCRRNLLSACFYLIGHFRVSQN
jgi:hypothetical protein